MENTIHLPPADVDDIFHYKLNIYRQIDDYCRIRIYRRADRTICIMSELKNSGMSVTNAVEMIIPQIFWLFEQQNNPLPENTIFIEHYDKDSWYGDEEDETFDRVTLLDCCPRWSRLSVNEVFLYLA